MIAIRQECDGRYQYCNFFCAQMSAMRIIHWTVNENVGVVIIYISLDPAMYTLVWDPGRPRTVPMDCWNLSLPALAIKMAAGAKASLFCILLSTLSTLYVHEK